MEISDGLKAAIFSRIMSESEILAVDSSVLASVVSKPESYGFISENI